jgi:hypothetical protein
MNSTQTANKIRQESRPYKRYGIDQYQSGHQVRDWEIPNILPTKDRRHILILEPLQLRQNEDGAGR